MRAVVSPSRVQIRKILLATDFSEASYNALTYALSVARGYDATIHALHVITPPANMCATPEGAAALESMEEVVQEEMAKVSARMSGLRSETAVERSPSVWSAVQEAIQQNDIDLVVVGTQGRTGVRKLLLGSTAEAIFHQARVPVLTIGPAVHQGAHNGGKFHCVLFATDLTQASLSAAAFAFSIAEDNNAKLILLHVSGRLDGKDGIHQAPPEKAVSAANIMHELHEMIPADAELWCRPEVVLKFGVPTRQILETAQERGADLIVLGPHSLQAPMAATHLNRGVSYNVVVRSRCPVLTVLA